MKRSANPKHLPFPWASGLRAEYPRWLRCARGERSSTVVEFAVSAMVLFTLVFGFIVMGLALYTYHFTADAAREGTRFAIVRGSSCNLYSGFASACPALSTDIQNYVRGLAFPGIDPSLMTVTTAWSAYPTGSTCTPSPTCNNPGNLVQVTVTYQFPVSIPFVPFSTLTMSSNSEMVISD